MTTSHERPRRRRRAQRAQRTAQVDRRDSLVDLERLSDRRGTRVTNRVAWRPPRRPRMSVRAAAAHNAPPRSTAVTVLFILSASAIAAAPASPIQLPGPQHSTQHSTSPPPRQRAPRAQRTAQVDLRERFIQELDPHAPQRSFQIRVLHHDGFRKRRVATGW